MELNYLKQHTFVHEMSVLYPARNGELVNILSRGRKRCHQIFRTINQMRPSSGFINERLTP